MGNIEWFLRKEDLHENIFKLYIVHCIDMLVSNASSSQDTEYSLLGDQNVRLLGRGELTTTESRTFNWTNAGFEFEFSGTKAEVYADKSTNDNSTHNGSYFTMAVYNGDELVRTSRMKLVAGWNTIYTYKSGDPENKKIMLVRSSEACCGTISMIKIKTDSVPKASLPRKKLIEFIGASYTAGYGNVPELSTATGYTAENTDNWNSYTGVVARHYNADNNVIAYQGKGVYANRSLNSLDNTMSHQFNFEEIYVDSQALNMSTKAVHNFYKYQPHVVAIWLGTNDAAASVPTETFKESYIKLLDNVRARYHNAAIVCMAVPNSKYSAVIAEIVDEQIKRAKNKVYFHSVGNFSASGIDNHPNVIEHKAIAEELINTIDKIPGVWDVSVAEDGEDTKLLTVRADYNTGNVTAFGKTDYEDDFISMMVLKSETKSAKITGDDIVHMDQQTVKNGEYVFEFKTKEVSGDYIFYMNSRGLDSLQQRNFVYKNYIPTMLVKKGEEQISKIEQLSVDDVINVTLTGFELESGFSGMLAIAQYEKGKLSAVDVFDTSSDSQKYGTEIKKQAKIIKGTDRIKVMYWNEKTLAPLIGMYVIE